MLNSIVKQVPVRLWKRHAVNMLRYSSKKKIINAIKSYISFLKGDTVVSTMPSFLKVELSRHCTVHCTECTFPKEYRFYSFDKFRSLVDKFGDYVFMSQLYEIGEPLYYPEIIQSIRCAHSKKIATAISTTLSLKKPDSFWEELACSGLDRLIVAIDGVTKPVYNQYRTHGNLELVMNNLKKILKKNRKICLLNGR